MAASRVPRLCAAIPSIESLTMNATSPLRRTTPSQQHISCRTYKSTTLGRISNPPLRTLTASARSASDNVEALQQHHVAEKRREETFQTSIAHNTSEASQSSAINPSISDPNTIINETSAEIPAVPSEPPSRSTSSPSLISQPTKLYTGRVTRTSTMSKTVAVHSNRQYFDKFLQKHYTQPFKTLVHDPNEILVEGDTIEYSLFDIETRKERKQKGRGKRVRYVVREVVTPFGVGVEERVPGGNGRVEKERL